MEELCGPKVRVQGRGVRLTCVFPETGSRGPTHLLFRITGCFKNGRFRDNLTSGNLTDPHRSLWPMTTDGTAAKVASDLISMLQKRLPALGFETGPKMSAESPSVFTLRSGTRLEPPPFAPETLAA